MGFFPDPRRLPLLLRLRVPLWYKEPPLVLVVVLNSRRPTYPVLRVAKARENIISFFLFLLICVKLQVFLPFNRLPAPLPAPDSLGAQEREHVGLVRVERTKDKALI